MYSTKQQGSTQRKQLSNEELFNEVISFSKEGKIITEAIKAVCEKYQLNFGSVKSRWYKILKVEPYKNRYQIFLQSQQSSLFVNEQNSPNIAAESKSIKNWDSTYNETLLNLYINNFNNFYQIVKDNKEIVSKLLVVQEHQIEINEYKSKLEKYDRVFEIAKQIEEIIK
ncbi:hypothetical protein [Neobacillus mesonae]|uniref:hypothetical protein n=1 Tax=Neobacillus mesonae TaxID=1193713 RepID=UPI00203DC69F|nr:hypothetical protein [Neobacillus mesonae]MCM3568679.1 hypothetical protein [Neobacillus mesonae]